MGLSAGVLARLLRRHRVVGVLALALLGVQVAADLWQSFPDYHLNGYQYLGERWLKGRASMGYNGVVTLPTDGMEQCLRVAMADGREGATVYVYYAWTPEQVVAWTIHGSGLQYVMGTQERDTRAPRAADYVVIGLEMDVLARAYTLEGLPDGWRMVDREWLAEHFEKVYSVRRAFDLEVASLWRRRADASIASVAP